MQRDKGKPGEPLSHIAEPFETILRRLEAKMATTEGEGLDQEGEEDGARPKGWRPPASGLEPGRYDFDLAEFPVFRFEKPRLSQHDLKTPLVYKDSIRGKDGALVERQWKAYPGAFGFGGASTQVLFYDLLQLYVEQGARGSQIQFGTIRSLLLRRGTRHPSSKDFTRVRRDIDILRGYDFHCQNAFWDRQKQAYVDMKWKLFGSVFYFKEKPTSHQEEMPFGFVEVSPILREIARTRGFFALGFQKEFFYGLRPLEQRLATYLAKKFISQAIHQRFVDDLAHALPIEASRPDNVRMVLKRAVDGLLEKGLPSLRDFRFEKSREGRWLAVFTRGERPAQDSTLPARVAKVIAPEVAYMVDLMVEATGNGEDKLWWAQCARRLEPSDVHYGLSQLKEVCQVQKVRDRGSMLTHILKDIAQRRGLSLSDEAKPRGGVG